MPASPNLIVPCPTADIEALQPAGDDSRPKSGTRSLLGLRLPPGSYCHSHSTFLGFTSSTGFAPPWLGSPSPLPASFPGDLEPGLSICSGSASISLKSPGKETVAQQFLLSRAHPLPESSGYNGSLSLFFLIVYFSQSQWTFSIISYCFTCTA